MTSLYRSGSQTAALRACTKLRKLLVERLGVEPSTIIRSLEEAVLRQDLAWSGKGSQRVRSPYLRSKLQMREHGPQSRLALTGTCPQR